jgi:hypothetical protein
MTPLEAERIINEYGAVLERTSSMTYGVSETLLPFDKDIIKQVFRIVLAFLKTNPKTLGEDMAQHIEQLKVGYMFLATFIAAEDARIAAAANAALLSGDVNHPSWCLVDRRQEILSESTAGMKVLADEFTSFLNRT